MSIIVGQFGHFYFENRQRSGTGRKECILPVATMLSFPFTYLERYYVIQCEWISRARVNKHVLVLCKLSGCFSPDSSPVS